MCVRVFACVQLRGRKPLLSLAWLPWDANMLIVAEERRRFMTLDVRWVVGVKVKVEVWA